MLTATLGDNLGEIRNARRKSTRERKDCHGTTCDATGEEPGSKRRPGQLLDVAWYTYILMDPPRPDEEPVYDAIAPVPGDEGWRSRERLSCNGWSCVATGQDVDEKKKKKKKRAGAPILPVPTASKLPVSEYILPVEEDLAATTNPCLTKKGNDLGHWEKKEGPCDLIKIHPLPSYPLLDQIALGYPRRWVVGNTMWGLIARDRITAQCIIVETNESAPCNGFDFSLLDGKAPQLRIPSTPVVLNTTSGNQNLAANSSNSTAAPLARRRPFQYLTPYGVRNQLTEDMCLMENAPVPQPCTDIIKFHKVLADAAN